jgi:hypothetical protein
MDTTFKLRPRMSLIARLGMATVAGALLVGAPLSEAHAASNRTGVDDDAPITVLGEQLAAKQRDAGAMLKGIVQQALDRAGQRMHAARSGMEQMLTFGYGLEGLAAVDFSALEEPAAEEAEVESAEVESAEVESAEVEDTEVVEPKAEAKRSRRLEYVEDTNDPLAGL